MKVALEAEAEPPGIGAYTIDIAFDPSAVTPDDCTAHPSGTCNPHFAEGVVRVTGATSGGLSGPAELANIGFEVLGDPGSCTTLHLDVVELTNPDRANLLPVPANDGEICVMAGLGDVNCDGAVTAVDAQFVLQYGAGVIGTLPCSDNADANEDGAVNSIDALVILQYNAGLVDSLPP